MVTQRVGKSLYLPVLSTAVSLSVGKVTRVYPHRLRQYPEDKTPQFNIYWRLTDLMVISNFLFSIWYLLWRITFVFHKTIHSYTPMTAFVTQDFKHSGTTNKENF